MPRMLLIQASPTPWDEEDRIVGSRPLPLTAEGRSAITARVEALSFPVERIYCPQDNEACAQAAEVVAAKFNLRLYDQPGLQEVGLGLWEGLAREDLLFRFPTIFPEWEEHPLAVNPPDGEPLADAIARLAKALSSVRRRARRQTAALALRPLALQIVLGLLHRQTPEAIAAHLHQSTPIATIDI